MESSLNPTVIVALITAISAIFAPVITALITARTNIRLKELELFEMNTKAAVTDLAKSYAKLIDNQGYLDPYWDFISAGYTVLSLVPVPSIQNEIYALLSQVMANDGKIDGQTTDRFNSIIRLLSNYLAK